MDPKFKIESGSNENELSFPIALKNLLILQKTQVKRDK